MLTHTHTHTHLFHQSGHHQWQPRNDRHRHHRRHTLHLQLISRYQAVLSAPLCLSLCRSLCQSTTPLHHAYTLRSKTRAYGSLAVQPPSELPPPRPRGRNVSRQAARQLRCARVQPASFGRLQALRNKNEKEKERGRDSVRECMRVCVYESVGGSFTDTHSHNLSVCLPTHLVGHSAVRPHPQEQRRRHQSARPPSRRHQPPPAMHPSHTASSITAATQLQHGCRHHRLRGSLPRT